MNAEVIAVAVSIIGVGAGYALFRTERRLRFARRLMHHGPLVDASAFVRRWSAN